MILAIDFDGTIVAQDHAYDDLDTPLKFMPGAKEALTSLKAAGHTLILWSGRASKHLRVDPELHPLVRAGVKKLDRARWERESRDLNQARYEQMIAFVDAELPGIFDAVDEGDSGKPPADVFIDDKALRYAPHGLAGHTWATIDRMLGSRG